MNSRLLSALLGSCAFLSPTPFFAEEAKSLPQIEVVRTWGDLVAQQPVTLQNMEKDVPNQDSSAESKEPLTLRLGIDRTESKKQGGVLLYCLAQGDIIQIDRQTNLPELCIGPFSIDVRGPNQKQLLKSVSAMITDRFMLEFQNALFMKPIPLSEAGAYVITLRQELGGGKFRDVASVNVIVTPELAVAWSPWMAPKNGLRALEVMEAEYFAQLDVSNPPGGVALPKWDGGEPIFLGKAPSDTSLPEENHPLPEWIAAKPDPAIQLNRKGTDLIVKVDEEISETDPEERFLTRWWVNDKPFTPSQPAEARVRAASAKQVLVKEVHFRMEFHPEYLDLKAGDTVGVQLLFCPGGWDFAGPEHLVQMAELADIHEQSHQDMPPKAIARMSNRLNFVYSGNPGSPANVEKP